MRTCVFILFFTITLVSCKLGLSSPENEEDIIASVGSNYLYKSDLLPSYETDMTAEDSAVVANIFIENWAYKQILLEKAKLNLSVDDQTALKEMSDDYRDDLYINSYKEALVAQNIDTTISDKEIEDFYLASQNIFRLKEELLQYRCIGFDAKQVNSQTLKKLFIANDSLSLETLLLDELKFYILQLNDTVWFTFTDFQKMYPIVKTKPRSNILHKNRFFSLKDSIYTYHFVIKNILKRNEIAPLEYITPVIKQMIIHKKKLEYLTELEDKLIRDALKNNTYKKY